MPAEGSSNSAENRPVRRRVRTGCQRCRIRRRKCDERKPVCSNCADRNFECQYGLQLRFPAGNARTAPRIETAPAAQYTQIRFAGDPEEGKSSRQLKENPATAGQISSASFSEPADQSYKHHRKQSAAGTSISGSNEEAGDEGAQQHQVPGSASPNHNDPYRIHRSDHPRQHNDHFALASSLEAGSAEHGAIQSLVSLANSVDQAFVFEDNVLSHSQILTASEDGHLQHDPGPRIPTQEPNDVAMSTVVVQPPRPQDNGINEERDLELLQYYRYHVAPWLDVLDLNQHLGLHLPAIGTDSPSTLYALHALSARHRELASGVPEIAQFESDRYYNMSKWGNGVMRSTEASDTLEARIIRLIVDLISAPFSNWTRQLEYSSVLIAPIYAHVLKSGLPASLFWCIFRFDLAAALVNESSMTTDLELVMSQNRFSDGFQNPLERFGPTDNLDPSCVDPYTLRALCMCGMAIGILQDYRRRESGDESPDRTRPQNHLARWQSTWNDLSRWYTERHKFVRPLLELSLSAGEGGESNPFPSIVFTTAAAALANLAYHTAAMVLLDCKPKTLKIPGQHSPVASLHWHAQRICAIAVSHASFQNWDPCMIACVLRAARKMTHSDQQTGVLDILERARETTGWKIDGELLKLQEFWRLAEHS